MNLAGGDSVVAVATTNGKKLDAQDGNGDNGEISDEGEEQKHEGEEVNEE